MRKILFVDDEQHVLDGLKRMLRGHRKPWDMSFALGGEPALALMDLAAFDVIVSDMRMPGMDGATLLEAVRLRHPQVVRIILTGYTDLRAALRTVKVAHQFLLKPCDAAALAMAVERACSLQGILTSATLARMIGSLGDLPSAPRAYTALEEALGQPEPSLNAISAIVEQDVALSAKVLQLVNSAFFGLARNTSSVRHAITYLGVNILQSLLVSAQAFQVFERSDLAEGFSMDRFQRHAQLAARISATFSLPRHQADAAVVASMLHDIGELVLASRLPTAFRKALTEAREKHLPVYEVERELYGVSHAEVGAYLLALWGLSPMVTEAVAHHHEPNRVPHEAFDAVTAVYLSDALAHELEDDLPSAGPSPAMLQGLGIATEYPALRERALQAGFGTP